MSTGPVVPQPGDTKFTGIAKVGDQWYEWTYEPVVITSTGPQSISTTSHQVTYQTPIGKEIERYLESTQLLPQIGAQGASHLTCDMIRGVWLEGPQSRETFGKLGEFDFQTPHAQHNQQQEAKEWTGRVLQDISALCQRSLQQPPPPATMGSAGTAASLHDRASIQHQLDALTADRKQAVLERDQLLVDKQRLAATQYQLGPLQQRIATLEATIAQRDQQIIDLHAEVQRLGTENARLLEGQRASEQTIDSLGRQLEEAKSQAKQLYSDKQKAEDEGRKREEGLRSEIGKLRDAMRGLEDPTPLRQRIAELSQQLQSIQVENAQLRERLGSLQSRSDSQAHELLAARGAHQREHAELEVAREQLQAKETANAALGAELGALRASLQAKSDLVSRQQADLDIARQENVTQAAALSQKERELAQARVSLTALERQIAQHGATFAGQAREILELRAQLHGQRELRTQLSAAQAALLAEQQRNTPLIRALEEATGAKQAAERELAPLLPLRELTAQQATQLQQLQQQVLDATARESSLRIDYTERQRILGIKDQEIQQLRAELDSLRSSNERRIDELAQSVQDKDEALRQRSRRFEELSEQFQQFKGRTEQLIAERVARESQLQQALASQRSVNADLLRQLAEARRAVDASEGIHTADAATIRRQREEFDATLHERDAELTRLRQRLQEQDESIQSIQRDNHFVKEQLRDERAAREREQVEHDISLRVAHDYSTRAVTALNEQLGEQERELETLRGRVSTQAEQLQEKDAAYQRLFVASKMVEEQRDHALARVQELGDANVALEVVIAHNRSQIRDLTSAQEASAGRIRALETQLEQAGRKHDVDTAEVRRLTELLTQAQIDATAQREILDSLRSEKAQLEQRIPEINARERAQSKLTAKAEREVEHLIGELKAIRQRAIDFEQANITLRGDLVRANDQLQPFQETIKRLQREARELQENLQIVRAERDAARGALQPLKDELRKAVDEIRALHQEKDSLKAEQIRLDQITQERDALQERIGHLEQSAREADERARALQIELDRKAQTISSQAAEITAAAERVQHLSAQLQRETESSAQARLAVVEKGAQVDAKTSELERVQREATQLRHENEQLQQRVQALEPDLARATHELSTAEATIGSLRAQLTELGAQNTVLRVSLEAEKKVSEEQERQIHSLGERNHQMEELIASQDLELEQLRPLAATLAETQAHLALSEAQEEGLARSFRQHEEQIKRIEAELLEARRTRDATANELGRIRGEKQLSDLELERTKIEMAELAGLLLSQEETIGRIEVELGALHKKREEFVSGVEVAIGIDSRAAATSAASTIEARQEAIFARLKEIMEHPQVLLEKIGQSHVVKLEEIPPGSSQALLARAIDEMIRKIQIHEKEVAFTISPGLRGMLEKLRKVVTSIDTTSERDTLVKNIRYVFGMEKSMFGSFTSFTANFRANFLQPFIAAETSEEARRRLLNIISNLKGILATHGHGIENPLTAYQVVCMLHTAIETLTKKGLSFNIPTRDLMFLEEIGSKCVKTLIDQLSRTKQ